LDTVAALFDVSCKFVKELSAEYERTGIMPSGVGRGNNARSHKLSMDGYYGRDRVANVVEVACINFAADDRRMTYRQMTFALKENLPESADHRITYDATRRWAKRNGYRWTSELQSRKMSLATTDKAIAAAARYSRQFYELTISPQNYVFIYIDESYINQYHAAKFAVSNASNLSTVPHATRKGKRLCFATAIASNAGELKDCRWIFCPNKSEAAKRDYHASFNRVNYLHWFTNTLIPAINAAFPGRSCVVVMDNASYHIAGTAQVTVNEEVVKVSAGKSSKKLLAQWINENSAQQLTPQEVVTMSRAEIVVLFKQALCALGNDVERVAQQHNHRILFTPPRKSEWQPIEKFWAVVKNDVARQYTKQRTFPQVRTQLEASMDNFGQGSIDGSDTCSRIIAKTAQSVLAYFQTVREADARFDARVDNPFYISSESGDDDGYSSDEETIDFDIDDL
jgi:transposase